MATWRDMHADWDYTLYDNAYLCGRRWRNQSLINEYFRRGAYAGVADLMRYEILLETGGFIPEADSECLLACDALFIQGTLFTVYENEQRKPGLVSPFLAAAPGHAFVETVVSDLGRRWTPETLKVPWRSTGNRYLRFRIEEAQPDIVIFPSHYFIPEHKRAPAYSGDGPVYARQHWGSTRNSYARHTPDEEARLRDETLAALLRGSD